MHTRIIVAHPRLHGNYSDYNAAWVYADEKLGCHAEIFHSLGHERLLITPRSFQEEVQRLVSEFIPWADEQIPIDDSIEWLLTPFHRNPFSSNLMLHIFWLRLLAMHCEGRDVIVFTESVGLARSCADLCIKSGWEFVWHGKSWYFLHKIRITLRSAAKLVYDVLRVFVGWLSARVIMGKAHATKLQSSELLIDAYLYPDSITVDGVFRDKHLPGLYEWYQEQGIITAVYPFPVKIPLFEYPRLFRRMKACTVPMLPFELLLHFGDITHSAFSCLRHGLRSGGRHHFAGTEVTALVAAERFRAATCGLLPMMLAVAPSRLSDLGIKPRWFLDWFENQPIDRANTIGFTKVRCHVLALRLYSLYPMFASLFTTEREVLAGVCPVHAWVSGEAMEDQLNRFDRKTKYSRVPALRYEHLYTYNADQPTLVSQGETLALLLTHSSEESLAILDLALNALLLLSEFDPQIIVKPHPDYGLKQLREVVARRWPWADNNERLKWETGPLTAVLSEANIIISAGSSASIEAVCRGIPVILIGRKAGLDMNPLAGVDSRLWLTVYDAEELATALRKWLPSHPLPLIKRLEIGENLMRQNYEPSTPQSFEVFGKLP